MLRFKSLSICIIGFIALIISACGGTSSSSASSPTKESGIVVIYTYSINQGQSVVQGGMFTVTATLKAVSGITNQLIESLSLTPGSESFTFSSPATPCYISSESPTCTMEVSIGTSATATSYTLIVQDSTSSLAESNESITFTVTPPPTIFLTAESYTGNLSNVCANDSANPLGIGLGTWVADDSAESPFTAGQNYKVYYSESLQGSITPATSAYDDPTWTGSTLFNNLILAATNSAAYIGNTATSVVWVWGHAGSGPGYDCNGWTSSSGASVYGFTWSSGYSSSWSSVNTLSSSLCNGTLQVICVQQ